MLMQQYSPHPFLSDYIDSILLQEDLNLVNYANRNPVKVLPSTLAVIGIQYGNRMSVVEGNKEHMLGTSGITGLQTTFKEYRSTGSIGSIIIRFKPGGLTAFTRYPINELQNANISLNQIFPAHHVFEMEHRLQSATITTERINIIHAFLFAILEERNAQDSLIMEAVRLIQQHRGIGSIDKLASNLYVSQRTLERRFNKEIGISPKKFANIVRFQHVIELRKSGHDYLDIIEASQFSDQAHFVHDFKAFSGCSPGLFFQNEIQPDLAQTYNGRKHGSLVSHTMYQ